MLQRSNTLVSLCVCTFRRPQLALTLGSLAELQTVEGMTFEIVIADNDLTQSAAPIAKSFAATAPWPVVYVHAPSENISLARNACLEAASGRYLAFIDDDETAAPDWIVELMSVMQRENAAAVLGPVQAVYEETAPAWMQGNAVHSTFPVFVKGQIETGYTCNVLLDRGSEAVDRLRFNLASGKTGGEDTEYFTRLRKAGGTIGYAPAAWVHEPVPASRASMSWLAKRRFRMGQTHGRLLRENGVGRITGIATAAAKVGACLGLAANTLHSPAGWRRNALRGLLHAGTISGLLGLREIVQYGAAQPKDIADAA